MIVVDASVAAKWYLKEDGTDVAAILLDGIELLVAPEIIAVEVASAIGRRARAGSLPVEDVMRLLAIWRGDLSESLLRLEPWQPDFAEACRLACEISHPVADCLYLAAAIRLRAPLMTADRTFARRAAPIWQQVQLL